MKLLNAALIILGIFALIAVRMAEENLFYDPFLDYFQTADKEAVFPEFEWAKLIIHYVFRFSLNLVLSVLIVHFIFSDKKWTIQAVVLILLVFAITFPIYLYCIYTKFEIGYLFSFYMRRFVIQPLILLLIVPLFYYRKQLLKKIAN